MVQSGAEGMRRRRRESGVEIGESTVSASVTPENAEVCRPDWERLSPHEDERGGDESDNLHIAGWPGAREVSPAGDEEVPDPIVNVNANNGSTSTSEDAHVPASPGVWRRDTLTSRWSRYPVDIAEIIFTAFSIGESTVGFNFACTTTPKKRKNGRGERNSHCVNFQTMTEIEILAGLESEIKIVEGRITEINYQPTTEPVETGVWYRHNCGEWYRYSENVEEIIRTAWRKKEHFALPDQSHVSHSDRCIYNLERMEEINVTAGYKRPMKLIWNNRLPTEGKLPSDCWELTVHSLRNDLFIEALRAMMDNYITESMVRSMVESPFYLARYDISPEPQISDMFFGVLRKQIEIVPGCCGQLQRIKRKGIVFYNGPQAALNHGNAILKHAFCLASEDCNFAAISKSGLEAGYPPVDLDGKFTFHTDCYVPMRNRVQDLEVFVFLVVVPKRFRVPHLESIPVREIPFGHYLPIGPATLTNLSYDRELDES